MGRPWVGDAVTKFAMANLLIRNLSETTKARLRARAARHKRSLEAETRHILEQAAAESLSPDPEPFPDWFVAASRPGIDLSEAIEENRRPHEGVDLDR